MEKYYVKFRYEDDTYYSTTYDEFDLEFLLKNVNTYRFIRLPDDKTILNLNHVVRIDIEDYSK